jgi:hypothetical protein
MFLAFILIQLAINMALLASLVRLSRERKAYSVEASRREERLESLAAELCAVGQQVTRQPDPVVDRSPISDPGDLEVRSSSIPPEPSPAQAPLAVPAADRFQGAVRLLRQGVALETVAAETTLLEGEVQVLRNLARGSGPSRSARRVGRVGMGPRREAIGEGRRRAGGGRPEQPTRGRETTR